MNSTIARASNTFPKSLVILIIPVINAVMVRLYHKKNLEQQLSNSGSSSNLNWDQPKQKKILITHAQLHSTKLGFRFCRGLNSAYSMSDICNNPNLTMKVWCQLKTRSNTYYQATGNHSRKQFHVVLWKSRSQKKKCNVYRIHIRTLRPILLNLLGLHELELLW